MKQKKKSSDYQHGKCYNPSERVVVTIAKTDNFKSIFSPQGKMIAALPVKGRWWRPRRYINGNEVKIIDVTFDRRAIIIYDYDKDSVFKNARNDFVYNHFIENVSLRAFKANVKYVSLVKVNGERRYRIVGRKHNPLKGKEYTNHEAFETDMHHNPCIHLGYMDVGVFIEIDHFLNDAYHGRLGDSVYFETIKVNHA